MFYIQVDQDLSLDPGISVFCLTETSYQNTVSNKHLCSCSLHTLPSFGKLLGGNAAVAVSCEDTDTMEAKLGKQ